MFDVNAETGVMKVYGPIGAFEDGISAVDFMEGLEKMGGRDVTIKLQSEGGDVFDGLSIYNQLNEYQGKVTVSVDSLSASIASVLMMAADEIIASSNAHVMVHSAWAVGAGNADAFRGMAEVLDSIDEQIASIYAQRTRTKPGKWLDIMGKDNYFDAATSMELGLIDGIVTGKAANRAAASVKRPEPVRTALAARSMARDLHLRLKGVRK